jgi:hypothetical protein
MSITIHPAIINGVIDGPEVNMANTNAAQVMYLLGYVGEDQTWGEATPEDLLGRILIAQALLPFATDDEHGRPDVVEGNFTWCGTAPGYLAGRLAELGELAAWAHQHSRAVVWG